MTLASAFLATTDRPYVAFQAPARPDEPAWVVVAGGRIVARYPDEARAHQALARTAR